MSPRGRAHRLGRLALLPIALAFTLALAQAPGSSTVTPGAKLWGSRFDGPSFGGDGGSAVAASPDGSKVFVTGSSYWARDDADRTMSNYDYVTLAYDPATGVQLWKARYDGAGLTDYAARHIAVSGDGTKVVVTGTSDRLSGGQKETDYVTIAYDAMTGEALWKASYAAPPGSYGPTGLAVSGDGARVFIVGESAGSSTALDYATVAYDGSTGAKIWEKHYDGGVGLEDRANSVIVSADGTKVFVTGASLATTSSADFATLGYDAATGALLWASREPDGGGGFSLAISGSQVVVGGTGLDAQGGWNYRVLAYDSTTGVLQWTATYDGPDHDEDVVRTVAVSGDGSQVFVTGFSYGSGYPDYATIAYDAGTGARQWVARNSGCGGQPSDLAVSADGTEVFVTGRTCPSNYPTVAYKATNGQKLWASSSGPTYNNRTGIAASADGTRVFVTGQTYVGSGHGWDYATVAYDAPTGVTSWVTLYDGAHGGNDVARSIALSGDGARVYVTGTSPGTTVGAKTTDYLTTGYAVGTGAPAWRARYNGPANGEDDALAVAASPDSATVFVTGRSGQDNAPYPLYDYTTIAYQASTGGKLWQARYNGAANGDDQAVAVVVSPDGTRVFVTGYSSDSSTSSAHDYETIAYDASNGQQLWAARYAGPTPGADLAHALAVSGDGTKVFVSGESAGTYGNDYATLAYDASTGAQLWVSRYNGIGNGGDGASALTVSGDGQKVFVTGESYGGASGNDYETLAYNAATGQKLWATRYNGTGNGSDAASSLAVNGAGTRLYVTGQSSGGTSGNDYATLAYDTANGHKLWGSRYDGTGHGSDTASALAVNAAGTKLYVTGRSYGGSAVGADYATLAYDAATGAKLWGARYNGPGSGSDLAHSLGVSGDGNTVLVTGQSYGGEPSGDGYATIAYQG